MSPTTRWRVAALLPTALLLAMATRQIVLTRTASLTPWKGGGFGMFSTTDDVGRRRVRVFVMAPDRHEEIAIASALADLADQAAAQPDGPHLQQLGDAVAARERRHGRDVVGVRVECWNVHYSSTLAATETLLRVLVYNPRS